MLRLWISLLALAVASVWATAVASAQEDAPFRFDDPPADAPAGALWADLVVGEAAVQDDALVATIQVALLPEMQPGLAYVFVFHDGARDRFLGAGTTPTVVYFFGDWTDDGPGEMAETSGSYASGPGGTITVSMPLSALPEGAILTKPRGGTYDIKGDLLPVGSIVMLDEAEGEGELQLPGPPAATNETGARAEAIAPGTDDVAPASTQDDDARAATPGFAPLLALAALALAARSR